MFPDIFLLIYELTSFIFLPLQRLSSGFGLVQAHCRFHSYPLDNPSRSFFLDSSSVTWRGNIILTVFVFSSIVWYIAMTLKTRSVDKKSSLTPTLVSQYWTNQLDLLRLFQIKYKCNIDNDDDDHDDNNNK